MVLTSLWLAKEKKVICTTYVNDIKNQLNEHELRIESRYRLRFGELDRAELGQRILWVERNLMGGGNNSSDWLDLSTNDLF